MVMLRPDTVHTVGVVDVRATVRPEDAVAPEAKGVVLKARAPGFAKVMVCEAAETTSVTACVAAGLTPLEAVTVKLNVPVAVGVPAKTPPAVSGFMPVGIVPAVTLNVGAGEPVAVKVCEYALLTVAPAGAPLVMMGAAERFRVRLAAMGVSIAAPHVPSVSTPTDEVPPTSDNTYELAVALACEAKTNVVIGVVCPAGTSATGGPTDTEPPRSVAVAGLLIRKGKVCVAFGSEKALEGVLVVIANRPPSPAAACTFTLAAHNASVVVVTQSVTVVLPGFV